MTGPPDKERGPELTTPDPDQDRQLATGNTDRNGRVGQGRAIRPRGNAALRAHAAASGLRMKDLLVLSQANDPFNAGTASDVRNAGWFAELHGGQQVRHLRRLHYIALARELDRPDGTGPYENTDNCWAQLKAGASAARALGMVDPTLIVDARNPDPAIHFEARPAPVPSAAVELDELPSWRLPSLDSALDPVSFDLPNAYALGYHWHPGDQPVHVEVWAEKATVDDVLRPVCARMDVNYRSGPGFASITNTVDLVRRAAVDRPVRVFYISDFDPAGVAMPRAVARQIEFWADDKLDIALTPLVLTRGQVVEHALPRTPIKESDLRRGNFEATNGEGAVELDALEALHPGQLARIVADAVAEHRDPAIQGRLHDQADDADDEVTQAWEAETFGILGELAEVESAVTGILASYRLEIEGVADRLKADLAEHRDHLRRLRRELEARASDFHVDLPARVTAEAPTDRRRWLYDSRRAWLDQLDAYKTWASS